MTTSFATLIEHWKGNPGGTYRSWFLWEERIKNFRSIRSFLKVVIAEIEDGSFGTAYRESSLETAVKSIGEQRQIDVLWLERDKPRVAAAFEVEHTTSIYSGIIRLLDLALGAPGQATRGLFLVAPDDREEQVRVQLQRPAFRGINVLEMRFLPYSELEQHRGSMARFGAGLKAIEAVARTLV